MPGTQGPVKCYYCKELIVTHKRCQACGILVGPVPHPEHNLHRKTTDVIRSGERLSRGKVYTRSVKSKEVLSLCGDCYEHSKHRHLRMAKLGS